jgi:hypothetical protein
VQPTTQATRGFFFKLGYFRELFTVWKIISNRRVTAMPIKADRGCPVSVTVESTASRALFMNSYTSWTFSF